MNGKEKRKQQRRKKDGESEWRVKGKGSEETGKESQRKRTK